MYNVVGYMQHPIGTPDVFDYNVRSNPTSNDIHPWKVVRDRGTLVKPCHISQIRKYKSFGNKRTADSFVPNITEVPIYETIPFAQNFYNDISNLYMYKPYLKLTDNTNCTIV